MTLLLLLIPFLITYLFIFFVFSVSTFITKTAQKKPYYENRIKLKKSTERFTFFVSNAFFLNYTLFLLLCVTGYNINNNLVIFSITHLMVTLIGESWAMFLHRHWSY